MERLNQIRGREPVAILAAVQALVSLAVVFGLDLDGAQEAAILAAVGTVLTLIARSAVTPVADPRLDDEGAR